MFEDWMSFEDLEHQIKLEEMKRTVLYNARKLEKQNTPVVVTDANARSLALPGNFDHRSNYRDSQKQKFIMNPNEFREYYKQKCTSSDIFNVSNKYIQTHHAPMYCGCNSGCN